MNPTNHSMYRLITTPDGRALKVYMAAILAVTEMDNGAAFPLKKFLKNFSTHTAAGRIVRTEGGYKLTPKGIDYFRDRFSPASSQPIDRCEVDELIKAIRQGGSSRWEPIN